LLNRADVEIWSADTPGFVERFASIGASNYAAAAPANGDAGMRGAPTRERTAALLSSDHPTRRRCDVKLFAVGDRGRVAAIVNPRLTDPTGTPYGLLGFFECDDDDAAAGALFDAACEWLRARGCKIARGPIDYTTWHGYRLTVDGFDAGWLPGEPFHPAYYPALWRTAGFTIAGTYSTNWIKDVDGAIERFAGPARSCLAAGYTARPLGVDTGDLAALHEISLAAFADAFMYSPIERDEFAALYPPGQAAAAAGTSLVACAPDGEPCGFLYGFVVEVPGRGRTGVIKSLAISPEHRGCSTYHLLFHRYLTRLRDAGVRDHLCALMHREGTPARMGWIRPDTTFKEYALYERAIA
jgi:hypothetical protein